MLSLKGKVQEYENFIQLDKEVSLIIMDLFKETGGKSLKIN